MTFHSTRAAVLGYLRFAARPAIALFLGGIVATFFIDWEAVRSSSSSNPAMLLVLGLPVALLLFALLMFTSMAVSALLARLTIAPEGVRYQRWPFRGVTARWDEVDRLQVGSFAGRPFATLLVRRRSPGFELSVAGGKLGSANYHMIPLQDFEGWADGTLASAIEAFGPRLVPPSYDAFGRTS